MLNGYLKIFKLTEVKPKVFLLDFKNNYDMAMYFLRYQEFYESASPNFRGKQFILINFMEWYSKKYGKGVFTYPSDWAGFNIPGNIIKQIWDLGIMDRTKYDYVMKDVHDQCAKKYDNFYLIGAVGKSHALKHEIAHGFFYTIPEYKKEMTRLVKTLDENTYKSMCKSLKTMGYTPKVYIDECQAYLSTGLTEAFAVYLNKGKQKQFTSLYNKYYKV